LERWDGPDRPTNPSAWVHTVGVNLLKRRWLRRRREADYTKTLAPPITVEGDAPALELWSAVAKLPERERIAVVLRYIGGLTEREVADAMKIKPGTVAATLSRARKTLGARLRTLGLDPTDTGAETHE
jgi:RNA polymerase sigma-70 factor (ECF subfamily)